MSGERYTKRSANTLTWQISDEMSCIHPGRLFLEGHREVSGYEDVLAYAEFLRKEAGLSGQVPVDLQAIFTHFEIPEPKIVMRFYIVAVILAIVTFTTFKVRLNKN